jgi:nitrite reductase/ring-hydroxylating ferredoxin subunit
LLIVGASGFACAKPDRPSEIPGRTKPRVIAYIKETPGDNEEDALEKISRERFIRLGTALGVGAASASLAACGGGASSSGGSGDKKSGGGSSDKGSKAASSSDKAAIAAESDVAPGGAVTFKDAGSPAVLVHLKSGDFVAYSAVCTHQGCTVAYKNGQLACPCHGSVFDPAKGAEVIAGPAPSPLPEIPVKVEGGDVVKA